jgi:hypothetical protein
MVQPHNDADIVSVGRIRRGCNFWRQGVSPSVFDAPPVFGGQTVVIAIDATQPDDRPAVSNVVPVS